MVADEIRQLSEQTKDASNRITGIINELIDDTKEANASIENSAVSVEKQNELIETTKMKLEKVYDDVTSLTGSIENTDHIMKSILATTSTIADDITQLSATSEEVTASAEEGVHTSEKTVDSMRQCRDILNDIYALSKELKA